MTAYWLDGNGVAVRGLRTPYGGLDFTMQGSAQHLSASIAGDARPPGGFSLRWPFADPPGHTTVNGQPAQWTGQTLTLAAIGRPLLVEIVR